MTSEFHWAGQVKRSQEKNTRANLLNEVKTSRAARELEKRRQGAALTIQKVYRAWKVRKTVYARFIREWLVTYRAKVVDTSFIPSQEFLEEILRPALFIFMPKGQFKLQSGSKKVRIWSSGKLRIEQLNRADIMLQGCVGLVLKHCLNAIQTQKLCNGKQSRYWTIQMQRFLSCLASIGFQQGWRQDLNAKTSLLHAATFRLFRAFFTWSIGPKEAEQRIKSRSDEETGVICIRNFLLNLPDLGAWIYKVILDQKNGHKNQTSSQSSSNLDVDGLIAAILTCIELDIPLDQASEIFCVLQWILGIPILRENLEAKTFARLCDANTPMKLLRILVTIPEGNFRPSIQSELKRIRQAKHENPNLGIKMEFSLSDPYLCACGNMLDIFNISLQQDPSADRFSKHGNGGPNSITAQYQRILAESPPKAQEAYPGLSQQFRLLQDSVFLQRVMMNSSIDTFLKLMLTLISSLEISKPKSRISSQDLSSNVQPYLNTLAFGVKGFLPQAWRCLATNLGMPLDAPKEASQGWDIPTLKNGFQSLDKEQQGILGLFCRVYFVRLLILDDDEFYTRESVMTLGQQRAIATALNSLVFNQLMLSNSGQADPALKCFSLALLQGLYERDARKSFCPNVTWIAPYIAHEKANSSFNKEPSLRRRVSLLSEETSSSISHKPVDGFDNLLDSAPHCIPFSDRLNFFRDLISNKGPMAGIRRQSIKIMVRRGHILEDGMAGLYRSSGKELRGHLRVSFVDKFGNEEMGQDGGGLLKEFLEEVLKEGFQNKELFCTTSEGHAYPNPAALLHPQGEMMIEFLGMMLAKMLHEGMLIDYPLASFFIARLQGRLPFFDELSKLDLDLHKNLLFLKRYDGDASDLGLTFTVDDTTYGTLTNLPLCEQGGNITVTNSNKLQYIQLLTDWHLNKRLSRGYTAFSRGMNKIISAAWLRWFNPSELNQLLSGGESNGFDPEELANCTVYSGGYSSQSTSIKLFWKTVKKMSSEDRKALLKFVTSTSRAPLGGFKFLNPAFTLHKVPCEASPLVLLGGQDVQRLPTASTCFNTLKLPNYRREATMRQMLLAAIHSNAGFDLS